MSTEKEEFIWNFAFGSNMNSKILEGTRKLIPVEKVSGSIKGYSLDFLEALPYIEPGMGTIARDEDGEIHGILVKFTKQDFEKLYDSEGGPNGGYKLTELNVSAYDGRTIKAYAFESKKGLYRDYYYQPSERYYKIVKDGAIENKLDPKYIEYLNTQVVPYKFSYLKLIILSLFNLPLAILLAMMFFGSRLLMKCGLHSFLKVLNYLMVWFFQTFSKRLLWFEHDYFWIYIFGNGGKLKRKKPLDIKE